MRLRPLLRHLRMDPRVLLTTLDELSERYWITIIWHKAEGTANDEFRAFTDIDRLCTTRFGRRKYRSSWPMH